MSSSLVYRRRNEKGGKKEKRENFSRSFPRGENAAKERERKRQKESSMKSYHPDPDRRR